MTRRLTVLICAVGLVCACKRAPDNKEAIQAGVIDHLKKSGALDLNQVEVAVGDVKYQGNEAVANVSFKPKSAPQQGMSMSYTLERRGDKWQVKGRGAGHGGGTGGGMMGGGQPGGAGEMPSGHPPVNTPGGQPGAGTKSGDLPAGHPPVNAPAPQKK